MPNDFITLPKFKYDNPTYVKVETAKNCAVKGTWEGEVRLLPNQYQSVSILTSGESLSVKVYPFQDDYTKSKDGNARIR